MLSNAGHIASLVNPPGNPKASYWVGGEPGPDAEEWRAAAEKRTGSWWEDWADGSLERSGDERPAPAALGSDAHPPLDPPPAATCSTGPGETDRHRRRRGGPARRKGGLPVTPTAQDQLPEEVRRARQHSVGDLLRRTAARLPDNLAVVADGRRATFEEFNRDVNRLADSLQRRGLAKGDRLALLSHNCWEFALLAFATAKVGVVLVPVNFMLTADEVAYIVEHSEASAFVVESTLVPTAESALARVGGQVPVRGVVRLSGADAPDGWEDVVGWTAQGDDAEPDVLVDDDDPLRLMYTSGTESRPKGAVLTSRSLVAQYVSCVVDGGMAADDVEVHSLPMYHCAQLDCFFIPDVYVGATSVLLPGPDPEQLLRALEAERATKLFAPPTVWISLLRSPAFEDTDLSCLRKGYYGASAMPVEVLREIQQRLPAVRLWNFYGQTEMAPVATILGPQDQLSHAGSAGRPVLNVETLLVDDDGRTVPVGQVGEIVHRSPQATLGYWKDDAKTREASATGGSTRATWASSTPTATSPSSTGRRT